MYSGIAKHIFYPIGEKILGTTMLNYLRELEETQWWSPERLRELQNQKLRALVKHAYQNVPHYRRIFAERGLTSKDIQTAQDLRKLPILTKDDIRQNPEDMIAKDFKKWNPYSIATAGSTGEPLRYYVTMDVASIVWASTFRAWGWAGYRLGDKWVIFGGTSLVPGKSPTLFRRARGLVERTIALSSVAMDEGKMALYAEKLIRYKPKFIYCYPSAMYALADYLRKEGITAIRPIAIFPTAETLLASYRDRIEKQFGCKVFDQYGGNDGGAMATECPTHRGYHVACEKAIVEFISNGEEALPGEPGQIVATDLHNYAMPFVRYATGDMGVLAQEQCPCGRGLPLVEAIEGMTSSLITFSNGVRLSGKEIGMILQEYPIKQFQIIQETRDKLVIKLIRAEAYADRDTEHFLSIIRWHAGEGVAVETEFVDHIVPTKAGKSKFVISKVASE